MVFRCPSLHRGASVHALQEAAVRLSQQWTGHPPSNQFSGVTLSELDSIEDKFNVNIDAFEFDEARTPVLFPLRRSPYKHTGVLKLLRSKISFHVAYIINIDRLGHVLSCRQCNTLWKTLDQLDRHEKGCTGTHSKHKYPGGVYNPPQSILQRLLQLHGFNVGTSFVFPYWAIFDFEVFLFHRQSAAYDIRTHCWYRRTRPPIGVYGLKRGRELGTCKFCQPGEPPGASGFHDSVFIAHIRRRILSSLRKISRCVWSTWWHGAHITTNHRLESQCYCCVIAWSIKSYLHKLPVIGFNSGKYDLNVIKPYLLSCYCSRCSEEEEEEEEEQQQFTDNDDCDKRPTNLSSPFHIVVKKNSNYMCIATAKLKYLDITNFLAPGFSYAKYLKAFEVKETKSFFFPYEYVTSRETLKDTALPPHTVNWEIQTSQRKNTHNVKTSEGGGGGGGGPHTQHADSHRFSHILTITQTSLPLPLP